MVAAGLVFFEYIYTQIAAQVTPKIFSFAFRLKIHDICKHSTQHNPDKTN